jgi:hypothetical protein
MFFNPHSRNIFEGATSITTDELSIDSTTYA